MRAGEEETGACDWWWKVWSVLRARFTRDMRETNDATEVFEGRQSLFNWSQDFETTLSDSARSRAAYAQLQLDFCSQFLEQFPDESVTIEVNFRRSISEAHIMLGHGERGLELLEEMSTRSPESPWGYAALGDVLSWPFWGAWLSRDEARAQSVLARGLERVSEDGRRVLRDRLARLREG